MTATGRPILSLSGQSWLNIPGPHFKLTFTFIFNVFLLLKNSNGGCKVLNLWGWKVLFSGMKRYNVGGWKDTNQGGWKVLGWSDTQSIIPLQFIGLAEDMIFILLLLCILATLVKVHLENWTTCYRQFQVQNYKKKIMAQHFNRHTKLLLPFCKNAVFI